MCAKRKGKGAFANGRTRGDRDRAGGLLREEQRTATKQEERDGRDQQPPGPALFRSYMPINRIETKVAAWPSTSLVPESVHSRENPEKQTARYGAARYRDSEEY